MNANGMIDSADEYEFVSFPGGGGPHQPVDRIDGHPMPLRSGDDVKLPKAEDVAFLWECVADKTNAFFRAASYLDNREFSAVYGHGVDGALTIRRFDWQFSSEQMTEIRNALVKFLGQGCSQLFAPGFLRTADLQKVVLYNGTVSPRRDIKRNEMLSAIDQRFGGSWAPTTDADSFKRGAKVEAEPVQHLFDDAKLLAFPCHWLPWTTSLGVTSWPIVITGHEEGKPNPNPGVDNQGGGIWFMDRTGWFDNVCGYFRPEVSAPLSVLVPTTFIEPSSLELWALVGAYNRRWFFDAPWKVDEMWCLVNMTSYFDRSPVSRGYLYRLAPGSAVQFCEAVAQTAGWTKYSLDTAPEGLARQMMYLMSCDLLLKASVPRTKWWSD